MFKTQNVENMKFQNRAKNENETHEKIIKCSIIKEATYNKSFLLVTGTEHL